MDTILLSTIGFYLGGMIGLFLVMMVDRIWKIRKEFSFWGYYTALIFALIIWPYTYYKRIKWQVKRGGK